MKYSNLSSLQFLSQFTIKMTKKNRAENFFSARSFNYNTVIKLL
jgi:hypothetical protein